MAKIGYARVSSTEQHLDRQTDALAAQGIERVFLEKVSGVASDRPELERMIDFVREGDTVVVESISRLARSTRDLLAIVEALAEKSVDLVSMKEAIDTQTPTGRFMLSVFAALSELERETLLGRQREGIDSALRRGVRFGRPRTEYPESWESIYGAWRSGGMTAVEAMRLTGLAKPTLYRMAKRWEAEATTKSV